MKPYEYKMGESTFYIHIFPPLTAMKILGEVQKALAPILGGITKEVTSKSDAQVDSLALIGSALGEALIRMPEHLDGERLEKLCKLLLNGEYIGVSVDGLKTPEKLSESTLNEVFTGRPFDMIALMYKVFEVNFLDFSKLSSVKIGNPGTGELLMAITEAFQTNSKK